MRLILGLFLFHVSLAGTGEELTHPGDEPIIYLLPGTGADCRLFRNIEFPFDTVHLEFPVPNKAETLPEFALRFIPRIDTTRKFILIGVSLGGMISTELADTLSPERVIVISSSKKREELPGRYRFMKIIPLNRVAPRGAIHWGARVVAPAVEKERKTDSLFASMIASKDPFYLKWAVNMMINWKRDSHHIDIVHIHGVEDHTIPFRKVNCDHAVKSGTHMMVYFEAQEISRLLNGILLE